MNYIVKKELVSIDSYELELVEGCLKNDRKVQKALYYKYCDAMYTVALRILNNKEMANDALQDAFIQVYRDIKGYKRKSTLGAWIKTIVVRTAIRLLKKEKLYIPYLEYENDTLVIIGDNFSGEYLEKAILSLSPGYRTVFLLIEVEGYTHREVGKMLKISEGTSKSQLFHAKKLLQKKLKPFVDWII